MAARANWKGYLRLSLVSCSVALYPAVSSTSRLKCHTINRKTGNRIKEEVIDSVTEEPVEREDRVKGCEVAKGELVPMESDELEEIKLESTHTINIERFVARDEVDQRYFEKPYYLVPEDKVSREAFAVIREAMKEKRVAGLGRLVIYRRERIVLLEPFGEGLLATLLRYQDEVRSPSSYFEEIGHFEAPEPMRALAAQLIEQNRAPFRPEAFEDRYEAALIALVRSKRSGKSAEAPTAAPQASNVVNLMDALRRSIEAEKSRTPPARAAVSGDREVADGSATKARGRASATGESARKPPASKRPAGAKPPPQRKGKSKAESLRKAS